MKRKTVSGMALPVLLIVVFISVFNLEPVFSGEFHLEEKAPDFTLTDIYGRTICLYNCSARIVLIEFFGTWCHPCIQQIPPLRNVYGNYSRDELEMISISSEDEGVLRDFAEEYSIEWILARDTAGVAADYDVEYVPTIFIVDAQRHIRYKHIGLTEESTLRSEIESLLPKTIYVDDDNTTGPWDGTPEHPYRNITSGLEHVSAGDTTYVYNGTYYEHLTISKSLRLTGENPRNTIIDGRGIETFLVKIDADSVTVSGFTLRNNGQTGIWLYNRNNNLISNNNITNNIGHGIYIGDSESNTIFNNRIINNSHTGIRFDWGSHSSIHRNEIVNNGVSGIVFMSFHSKSSTNNTIIENTIRNNPIGIQLTECNTNHVYHNDFINNTKQVDSCLSLNTWDDGYPSGGNYWSDYTDEDLYCGPNQDIAGRDGIWDHPYVIDSNNSDNYPLMKPYVPGILTVSIYTDKYTYHVGDAMQLGLNVTNPDSVKYLCFVIWVERPDSSIYLYLHEHSVILPIGLNYANPSFRTITLPSLPQGNYTWHAAFLKRVTHAIIVEDIAEWEFS